MIRPMSSPLAKIASATLRQASEASQFFHGDEAQIRLNEVYECGLISLGHELARLAKAPNPEGWALRLHGNRGTDEEGSPVNLKEANELYAGLFDWIVQASAPSHDSSGDTPGPPSLETILAKGNFTGGF